MKMNKFAVIDIGSNSVRLMVSINGKNHNKEVLTTRLAEGMGENLILQTTPMERSAKAVSFFVKRAKALGINNIWAFATAAVRNAKNKQEFLAMCKNLCGIEIDVVSGEKEAYLGILGGLGGNNGGLIDVGGASTEIVVQKNGKITYLKSFNIGCVSLTNVAGQKEKKAQEYLNNVFLALGGLEEKKFTAIGGSALSACAILLKLKVYDPNKTHGYVIEKQNLLSLKKKLYSLSLEERKNIIGLQEKRIETISSGVAILCFIMERLGLDQLTISEGDNLEGYLKDKTI
ncbi:MAG: hypothetical protein IKW33_01120 [Clostridia bacterium]|nr:hypothetical protein [Clostridia bacterium]